MSNSLTQLQEIALRIRDMREILDFSIEEMAGHTELDVQTYLLYESGNIDLPFTFIHKCAQTFGIEMTELLEGHSAHLSNYAVTRKGKGITTAKEDGITIQNLAPMFRGKLAEPYWVKYEYKPELQNQPIHTVTHSGQEFNLVVSGTLMVRVGDKT
ncbi:MAG: helix-turn-helix domain-containing protein, partial [Clostridia bacterium]|nr:helix-turn-helix domain-containing protein [Clostridia bacterium]